MVKLKHQGESIQGGEDGAVEADYIISGAATKEAALEQLLDPANTAEAISHPTYGTLYREQVPQLDEIDAEQGYWMGKVRWTVPNADASLDENEPIVSFNTIGGSGHLTHSKETIAQATLDSAFDGTPDFHRAIGVSSDGDVDGTEIIVPIYEWEETHLVNASTVTRNFRRDIFQATGTVCTAEFRDFAIGEALFMGASGTSRGTSKPWEINFRFAGSANAKAIKVDGIGPVDKDGWDYLWVYYVQEESAGRYIPKVAGVFVERVYERIAWAFMPGSRGGFRPGPNVFNPIGA